MTIDREQLVELLVEKTGMEQQAVEKQLSELVVHIRGAAEQGKKYEIEGFGTFSIRDDKLHFDAADELKTEINQKYAGMEPIELMGAFKEVAEAKKEERVEKPDTEAAETEADKAGEPATEKEELEEEIFKTEPETPAEPETRPEEEPFWFDDEEQPPVEEVPEPQSPEEPEKEAGERKKKTVPGRTVQRGEDTIGKYLTIAVIIIAVGIGGWLLYDMGVFSGLTGSGENGPDQASTEIPANQVPPAREQDDAGERRETDTGENETPVAGQGQQPADSESEPGELNESTKDTGQEVSGSEESESLFGLKGEARPEANNGYTIIVHSLRRENVAREQLSQLRGEGYRTIIVKANVNGETYWRVGIGQFRTVEDAQTAIETLPQPYQTNNFIKRIQ